MAIGIGLLVSATAFVSVKWLCAHRDPLVVFSWYRIALGLVYHHVHVILFQAVLRLTAAWFAESLQRLRLAKFPGHAVTFFVTCQWR